MPLGEIWLWALSWAVRGSVAQLQHRWGAKKTLDKQALGFPLPRLPDPDLPSLSCSPTPTLKTPKASLSGWSSAPPWLHGLAHSAPSWLTCPHLPSPDLEPAPVSPTCLPFFMLLSAQLRALPPGSRLEPSSFFLCSANRLSASCHVPAMFEAGVSWSVFTPVPASRRWAPWGWETHPFVFPFPTARVQPKYWTGIFSDREIFWGPGCWWVLAKAPHLPDGKALDLKPSVRSGTGEALWISQVCTGPL